MDKLLTRGLEELGLPWDRTTCQRLETYYRLLEEQNRVMDLTAVTGWEETVRRHFLDSAAVLQAASFAGSRVIDVGSGAGFPGLVMAILEPQLRLTALDSTMKRVAFLRRVSGELGLENVRCLHARAEESRELFGCFDYAVSRAVARLNVLCELCLPFVRVGGSMLAMKGADLPREEEEAAGAIRILGGERQPALRYVIPGTDIVRGICIIHKIGETPEGYPRRFARIQKAPL